MEPGNSKGKEESIRHRVSHPRGITGPASAPGLRDRIYQDLKDEARNQNRIIRKLTRFYDGISNLSSLQP